jgi:hypothetical protein
VPETTLAQEMRHLRRHVPMQGECVQTAKDKVIALTGQVCRRKRDDVVPRCRDDAAIEISRGCKLFT